MVIVILCITLWISVLINWALLSLVKRLRRGMDRMYEVYRGGDADLGNPPTGGSGIPSK
ncbi:MAG: hypothetical protein WBB37_07420 [bacterium]